MTNITGLAAGGKRPWRTLSSETKILLAVRAVLQSPRPLAISLNLSPAVAAQAKASPDWLRRQVVRNLRCALGRVPSLVMAFDVAGDRLHLHAAIEVMDD